MFGFTSMYGSFPGGQAEYVRVPKANIGSIKIPKNIKDEEVLFLSDILPTGYQAALNAGVGRVWPGTVELRCFAPHVCLLPPVTAKLRR